jgi:hypothetical protein
MRLAVALCFLAACHPQPSLRDALDGTDDAHSGAVDRGALARGEEIGALSQSDGDAHPTILAGVVDGRLCTIRTIEGSIVDSAEGFQRDVLGRFANVRVAYLFLGADSEVTSGTTWPAYETAAAATLNVVSNEVFQPQQHKHVDSRPMRERHIRLAICASAPEIPANANLLGVAYLRPPSEDRPNGLVVYRLVGSP